MDAREAREHLEMVDDILRRGSGTSYTGQAMGGSLVGIGLGAGLMNLAFQAGGGQGADARLAIAGGVLLAAGMSFMIGSLAIARRNAGRLSIAEIRTGKVMRAVWISVVVAFFCQPHILNAWAVSAIWSLGGAITMLVSGSFGDRRALAGGIAILASMLGANYFPAVTGYVLAAGFFAGYVAVGILFILGIGAPHDRE